jgi:hypothetical protein
MLQMTRPEVLIENEDQARNTNEVLDYFQFESRSKS